MGYSDTNFKISVRTIVVLHGGSLESNITVRVDQDIYHVLEAQSTSHLYCKCLMYRFRPGNQRDWRQVRH